MSGFVGGLPADTAWPDLVAALDPQGEQLCIGVANSPAKPAVPRISLTAAALLDTHALILLISGQAKRALVERVLADRAYTPPVAAILLQTRAPVRILWAP